LVNRVRISKSKITSTKLTGLIFFLLVVLGGVYFFLDKYRYAKHGELLYLTHCAFCHGDKLEGQPNWKTRNKNGRLPAPPHDETGHTWHHSDQLLFDLVKFGMVPPNAPQAYQSDMPAYENILTDEEIRTVLNYIKSHWPEEIRKRQSEL